MQAARHLNTMLLLLLVTVYSCEFGWDYYSDNCYYVSTTESWPWTAARTACQDMGGDLVSISDQAEMDFVESIS